jgi:DNA mismatch repair ATPase MutS
MALAGAPVRAGSLRVSPLALGASLRVQDSLQEGASRFFAELLCLRRVVALCSGPRPVLFLLDEILQGTNSHDRGIGATGLVHGLLARGAIGLVTTHDLALTAMVDGLASRARNAHFEDELRDGELHFDYRLREGVVRRSNALALMKSVGLELYAPKSL